VKRTAHRLSLVVAALVAATSLGACSDPATPPRDGAGPSVSVVGEPTNHDDGDTVVRNHFRPRR
jgi:hypothetical protein